ncbi:SRPBCC domain-containing protein [Oceanibaculum indicum]|uniref:Polyketide cyclase/dehydrase/lipid transport protein n=1 Tax=Oceanibaculum indicum TaxID=526216 RepID=A0A420WHU8_9PROT|nr:SRPBCC domain-containing protein [Oceanibaculum indicum]RKQ70581.1 hypothetical protein BCL74_2530 [Oceanibaculum indicum]
MRQVKTSIDIACSPGEVWRVLMDFPAYAEWNPTIQQIDGVAMPGHRLRLILTLPNGRTRTVRFRVAKVDVRRELRLRTSAMLPGLLRREHVFRIISRGAMGCTFYQEEEVSGLFSIFAGEGAFTALRQRFEAMNTALKARCEGTEPPMLVLPHHDHDAPAIEGNETAA